jgi:uncharacterized protein (DUF486 family)
MVEVFHKIAVLLNTIAFTLGRNLYVAFVAYLSCKRISIPEIAVAILQKKISSMKYIVSLPAAPIWLYRRDLC